MVEVVEGVLDLQLPQVQEVQQHKVLQEVHQILDEEVLVVVEVRVQLGKIDKPLQIQVMVVLVHLIQYLEVQ